MNFTSRIQSRCPCFRFLEGKVRNPGDDVINRQLKNCGHSGVMSSFVYGLVTYAQQAQHHSDMNATLEQFLVFLWSFQEPFLVSGERIQNCFHLTNPAIAVRVFLLIMKASG